MVFCAHLCPFHMELMVKGPNILKLHPLDRQHFAESEANSTPEKDRKVNSESKEWRICFFVLQLRIYIY